MARKLFCEWSPVTYQISVLKCRLIRNLKDLCARKTFARTKQEEPLQVLVYSHNSLIRRKLGNVNMDLQNNKAVNLSLAAPKINKVLICPGEIFSFWKLVGPTDRKHGYLRGLQISNGKTSEGIGGGMCQFTNLIHWMVCHTPLEIIEHHHHDRYDLFPDFNRQVPFGMGTSIFNNYLDYRFVNNTDITFQLITYTTDEYLCGEIRADKELDYSYHIMAEDEHFIKEKDIYYRCGKVYRNTVDKKTGNIIFHELLRENKAMVMYELSEEQKKRIKE